MSSFIDTRKEIVNHLLRKGINPSLPALSSIARHLDKSCATSRVDMPLNQIIEQHEFSLISFMGIIVGQTVFSPKPQLWV